MNCPELLLDFRKENGHGRRITAAQIMDGEKRYRMQWGDGSHSTLLSRDVIKHWPRLLFDFLVAKIKWHMPVTPSGLKSIDSTTSIESPNIVGNATKVLCKLIRSKIYYIFSIPHTMPYIFGVKILFQISLTLRQICCFM